MHQRQHHDVFHFARKTSSSQLCELLGEAGEDLPIGPRLPGRCHGGLHRIDEGVAVGGVQIVLLVPRRRRQHDVRVERRRVHPEVQVDDQVHLADRRVRSNGHLADAVIVGLGGDSRAVSSQVVLHEELVAFGRRADGVSTPDEPGAWPVLRSVRVIDGELDVLRLQSIDYSRYDVGIGDRAAPTQVADQLDGILLQRREEREPSTAYRSCLMVDRVLSGVVVGQ